jgi:integrase
MTREKKPGKTVTLERGEGNIVKKAGSRRLYYDIKYLDERVEISTGLIDNPENRKKALITLLSLRGKMDSGTFNFNDAFPKASPRLKALFAAKEGTVINNKPQQVKIGEYIPLWYQDIWENFESGNKKHDFKQVIDYWIKPFFGDRSFFDVNSSVVGEFIRSLERKKGKNKGRRLRRGSIRNILIPFQTIWNDACEKYRWELPSPFAKVQAQMPTEDPENDALYVGDAPKLVVGDRAPLRFDEFMKYLNAIDPWYRPITELWVLTGMIPSELAGVTVNHIQKGYLYIRRTISRGVEKQRGKTKYRRRAIRITTSIRRVLDVLLARIGDGKRLVTLKSGKPLTAASFCNAWTKAEKATTLPHHRVPYALRHTFAAWALTIGTDQNRLASLMGHGSKKMIYEVYGNYVEGLEHDRGKIFMYFGEDFVAGELLTATRMPPTSLSSSQRSRTIRPALPL